MSQLGIMPVVLVCLTALAFVIAYVWAVLNGDVYALFPYISDTGAQPPESCVFGLLLNFTSFLAFFVMYMRYNAVLSIVRAVDGTESRFLARVNKISFGFGCVAALGVSIVANFQEGTVVETVHFIGAFLAFVPGVVYCFLQTAMSFHMCPRFNGAFICRVRLAISSFCVVTCIITIVCAGISYHIFATEEHSDSTSQWKSGDPGYSYHVVSTVCEWVLALGFFSFYLTYAQEFNKFEVEVITRALVTHLDHSVDSSAQTPGGLLVDGYSNYGTGGAAGEPDERSKLLG